MADKKAKQAPLQSDAPTATVKVKMVTDASEINHNVSSLFSFNQNQFNQLGQMSMFGTYHDPSTSSLLASFSPVAASALGENFNATRSNDPALMSVQRRLSAVDMAKTVGNFAFWEGALGAVGLGSSLLGVPVAIGASMMFDDTINEHIIDPVAETLMAPVLNRNRLAGTMMVTGGMGYSRAYEYSDKAFGEIGKWLKSNNLSSRISTEDMIDIGSFGMATGDITTNQDFDKFVSDYKNMVNKIANMSKVLKKTHSEVMNQIMALKTVGIFDTGTAETFLSDEMLATNTSPLSINQIRDLEGRAAQLGRNSTMGSAHAASLAQDAIIFANNTSERDLYRYTGAIGAEGVARYSEQITRGVIRSSNSQLFRNMITSAIVKDKDGRYNIDEEYLDNIMRSGNMDTNEVYRRQGRVSEYIASGELSSFAVDKAVKYGTKKFMDEWGSLAPMAIESNVIKKSLSERGMEFNYGNFMSVAKSMGISEGNSELGFEIASNPNFLSSYQLEKNEAKLNESIKERVREDNSFSSWAWDQAKGLGKAAIAGAAIGASIYGAGILGATVLGGGVATGAGTAIGYYGLEGAVAGMAAGHTGLAIGTSGATYATMAGMEMAGRASGNRYITPSSWFDTAYDWTSSAYDSTITGASKLLFGPGKSYTVSDRGYLTWDKVNIDDQLTMSRTLTPEEIRSGFRLNEYQKARLKGEESDQLYYGAAGAVDLLRDAISYNSQGADDLGSFVQGTITKAGGLLGGLSSLGSDTNNEELADKALRSFLSSKQGAMSIKALEMIEGNDKKAGTALLAASLDSIENADTKAYASQIFEYALDGHLSKTIAGLKSAESNVQKKAALTRIINDVGSISNEKIKNHFNQMLKDGELSSEEIDEILKKSEAYSGKDMYIDDIRHILKTGDTKTDIDMNHIEAVRKERDKMTRFYYNQTKDIASARVIAGVEQIIGLLGEIKDKS